MDFFFNFLKYISHKVRSEWSENEQFLPWQPYWTFLKLNIYENKTNFWVKTNCFWSPHFFLFFFLIGLLRKFNMVSRMKMVCFHMILNVFCVNYTLKCVLYSFYALSSLSVIVSSIQLFSCLAIVMKSKRLKVLKIRILTDSNNTYSKNR